MPTLQNYHRALGIAPTEKKMLKLFVVIFVVTSGAFTCRWVCIDEYNNIDKRYYFNKNLFTFELPKREITLNNFDILPSVSKYKERTSRKLPIPGEYNFLSRRCRENGKLS